MLEKAIIARAEGNMVINPKGREIVNQKNASKAGMKPKERTTTKRKVIEGHNGDSTSEASTPNKKKKGHEIGELTDLGKALLKFKTSRYKTYLPNEGEVGQLVDGHPKNYDPYDHYFLVTGENRVDDPKFVPKHGVRVDDYTAWKLIEAKSRAELSTWKADFDTKGMLKAGRRPLGVAAKQYFAAGATDRDGHVLTADEAGWYYLWYKGLQIMCGDEGAKVYMKRPSNEKEFDGKVFFRKGWKAVIQEDPKVQHPIAESER